ncbi:hypothetical protein GCM10011511_13690 [Puia dinghuensis]|uniref:Uncharacterized protein n=1 Tax=Puia dinghuensis TaxID=1792502 RepID=A0A8J2UAY4_9BACT|nr:hypothetical protein GCM10011511_13690 [Puia dinghuensis]
MEPFSNCPGTSVAITRPGLNATIAPFQIYLIDSAGGIKPSGNPINLQINGFGLENTDGFLYGIHETSNVADPFLARVDKNGNFVNIGTLLPPPTAPFHVGLINTAAGTNDDKDNFYFLALVVNLQNTMEIPELFVGKVANVSRLTQNDNPIGIKYTPINPGTCLPQLLAGLTNPLLGVLQDIAFNPANGNIYTYFRAPGTSPTPGMLAWFNPADSPTFTCMPPPQPNIPTNDLCGLYFGNDSSLFILTTDGKDYKGNVTTGAISLVAQTSLPLLDGNLRGDMASCIGKKPLVAFDNCPGVSVAVTRTGINSTRTPYQIFTIDKTGNIQSSGNPIPLQINGFGLNNKDGFLYGLHETDSVTDPWFTRVDKFGSFVNISRLTPPPAGGRNLSIINTAAGTMDGNDNYYFTAITADTPISLSSVPRLFLGTIHHVSSLKEGDTISIKYKEVSIGTCAPDIITGLLNPKEGLLQDISFDPVNHIIYTTFPTSAASPTPAAIGHFNPFAKFPVLNCITAKQPNPPIRDMCGLFSGDDGGLFILTIDGKFYRGNVSTGEITLITQTALPLLGNNLRGDMASCVPKINNDNDDEDDEDQDAQNDRTGDGGMKIAPNPIQTGRMNLSVNAGENARVRLQIIGSTGVPLQTRNLNLVSGANQFRLDVTSLHQGVYTVILLFPSGRVNIAKFIKL